MDAWIQIGIDYRLMYTAVGSLVCLLSIAPVLTKFLANDHKFGALANESRPQRPCEVDRL